MLDERLQRVRRELDAPPWDDLRSTRVLGRVLEEVSQTRRRRRQLLLGGGAALSAAACAVAALVLWNDGSELAEPRAERPVPVAQVAAVRAETAVQPPGSVLTLSDGSRAELSPNAAVHALEQSAQRVAVRQSRGRVRYDVTERPEREFVVEAGEVRVRVLGTVFSVELVEEGVEVSVERGRVAVVDPGRQVVLTRGESVLLAKGELPEADALQASAVELDDENAAGPRADDPQSQAGAHKASRAARSDAPASADVLLARADEARQRGRLPQAAQALALLVEHHGTDPRAISALFTLGRVERARGRYGASARAFARCFERQPSGTLAEDALAESARAWATADRLDRARAAASQYLGRYPGGAHASAMHELAPAR